MTKKIIDDIVALYSIKAIVDHSKGDKTLVSMDQLDEGERNSIAYEASLNMLIGRKCAICDFSYTSIKDIESHGTIGGYASDVVGRGPCWETYVELHGPPNNPKSAYAKSIMKKD